MAAMDRHARVAYLTGRNRTKSLMLTALYYQDRCKALLFKSPSSTRHMWELLPCVRHLTDCGFMFECHLLLLYVNSFQLVTKEKTFQAVFEKVNLASIQ